jgi:TatD DNase family protein
MEVFKKQLLLAQTLKKPVIIHCVGAFQELIALKKELKLNIPLIVHGFSKSAEQAKQLVENGFYLSFGKYLIQNPGLKEVLLSVPNDRIFLETDVLDFNIADIYKLAAEYKAIDLVVLQNIIKNNFSTVFKQL